MAERINLWPVERLQPYAKNARTHSDEQVDQIAASMREFGFTNPILVDSSDGIIAGHGRLMAAKRLGLKQVPVIVLDHLTDAQRRAYILADNKLALNAGWDEGLLAQELADLQDEGYDLALTGFNDDELEALLDDAANDNDEDGGTFDDVEAERAAA
jgi:ParB/RepB/Spo0J family partition protein